MKMRFELNGHEAWVLAQVLNNYTNRAYFALFKKDVHALAIKLEEARKDFNTVKPVKNEKPYNPMFFSWCTSYEQEVKEMREAILNNPADVNLLKQEYARLTGKRFKTKRSDFE